MFVDRRTMLAGSAALVAAPAMGKAKSAKSGWYDQAIIIDALGGVGDPYGPEDQLRLTDRAWAEMVATGVTLLRDTVFPVGNVADPWGEGIGHTGGNFGYASWAGCLPAQRSVVVVLANQWVDDIGGLAAPLVRAIPPD